MKLNKQYVLPAEFLSRLQKIIPPSKIDSVLCAFSVKRPTTLRANTLKISARDLRNIFFEKGVKLENVPWYRDAFIVKNRTLRELMEIEISAHDQNFLDPQFAKSEADSAGPVAKVFQTSLQVARDKGRLYYSDLGARSSFGEVKFGSPSFAPPAILNLYKEGYYYVQSLSSMIPLLVLNPKPGEKILDICAAPGSKTTQMATMMGNKGEILANDTSPIRRLRLEANLKIQGVNCAYVSGFPAQSLWIKFPEFFDKTLCDVPCSMEGRFHTFEPESYKGWLVKKVRNLSRLQKWILRSAVSATKVGGRIIYSTCTLSPEENEEVIDWILEKEKGKVQVEKISVAGCQLSDAVMGWDGKKYNPEVGKTARILPSETMEGFFVASLRKIKSTVKPRSSL